MGAVVVYEYLFFFRKLLERPGTQTEDNQRRSSPHFWAHRRLKKVSCLIKRHKSNINSGKPIHTQMKKSMICHYNN
jgi:hypothetical protein